MINMVKKVIATGSLNSLRNWFWKWSWALDFQLSAAYVSCPPRTLSEDKLPCLTLTREENEWQNSSWVKTWCPWEQLEGESLPEEIIAVYPWWADTCSREDRARVQLWEAHPRREKLHWNSWCLSFSSQCWLDIGDAVSQCCCLIWLGSLTGEDVLHSTQNSLENISWWLQWGFTAMLPSLNTYFDVCLSVNVHTFLSLAICSFT